MTLHSSHFVSSYLLDRFINFFFLVLYFFTPFFSSVVLKGKRKENTISESGRQIHYQIPFKIGALGRGHTREIFEVEVEYQFNEFFGK